MLHVIPRICLLQAVFLKKKKAVVSQSNYCMVQNYCGTARNMVCSKLNNFYTETKHILGCIYDYLHSRYPVPLWKIMCLLKLQL